MNTLNRLLEANIVLLERYERDFVISRDGDNNPTEIRRGTHSEYVFYRDETRIVLGCNTYIASNTISFYPELYARLYKEIN